MKRYGVVLGTLLLLLLSTGCSNPYQEVHINGPAYMYSDDTEQAMELVIEGRYDKKEYYSFKGSISMGSDIKLENVLFTSGAGLVSYEGTQRSYLGQIFCDFDKGTYSIILDNAAFIEKLTKQEHSKGTKFIVSSPAANEKEAEEKYTMLRKTPLPSEKKLRRQ